MYSLILYQSKTVRLFPADLLRLFAAVCVVVIQAAYSGVLFYRKTSYLAIAVCLQFTCSSGGIFFV